MKSLPAKVNLRELDREHILNRNMSYNMCHKKCHIPKDKAVQICSLYQLDLAEFFEDVIDVKQYALETVKGHRRILRAIFNEAVRYEWITKNPVSATKIGVGNNNTSLKAITEKEVLTVSEMQQFIQALNKLGEEKINRKVVLETMLLTGIRKAEMAGLRWSDVDFDNRVIHIKRNKLYSLKKGTYEKAPKTKSSVRDIPIPDILIADLKAYYEWFKITDKDFDNKLDQYYLSSTIYRQPADANAPYTWLKKFLFDNGFKHRGCHSLRHTYCSILLSQNVPIQTVSKYMGHSDSSVTLQVYSHFIPDTQEKVLNVLNSIV